MCGKSWGGQRGLKSSLFPIGILVISVIKSLLWDFPLEVQWLRLHSPSTGALGLIPGRILDWIPRATTKSAAIKSWHSQFFKKRCLLNRNTSNTVLFPSPTQWSSTCWNYLWGCSFSSMATGNGHLPCCFLLRKIYLTSEPIVFTSHNFKCLDKVPLYSAIICQVIMLNVLREIIKFI